MGGTPKGLKNAFPFMGANEVCATITGFTMICKIRTFACTSFTHRTSACKRDAAGQMLWSLGHGELRICCVFFSELRLLSIGNAKYDIKTIDDEFVF